MYMVLKSVDDFLCIFFLKNARSSEKINASEVCF